MSVQLVVNGITYNYPSPGEDPGWGEEATAWAEAVTDLLSTFINAGDIIETSFTIVNNQVAVADVIGLSFDPATVRAAEVFYSVYRSTDSTEAVEAGNIVVAFKDDAGTWLIQQEYVGDSDVVFSITDGGQVQYTSSSMAGSNYSSLMKFRARTTLTSE